MDYEEFKEYIRNNLAGVYADVMMTEQVRLKGTVDDEEMGKYKSCEVIINRVTKNNGIILDAVSIYKEGDLMSPNIYLKPFYDSYMMGKPLDFVMTEIVFRYRNECADMEDMKCRDIMDYDMVKDRIIVRLINKERNREMLNDCPYIDYLDMAITFRYLVKNDIKGMATIIITNKEFKEWNVDKDELYRQALDNTVRMFPYKMVPLAEVVLGCFEERINGFPEDLQEKINNLRLECPMINMYILTNMEKSFGAGVILYDGVIRNFARTHDSNVYILPASVHEVMVVLEDDNTDLQFMKDMLNEVNNSSVGLVDILGNNIYYYDRKSDTISMCSES